MCPLDALRPRTLRLKAFCVSASFNGNTDGLRRRELINNSSAHVFIIICSSLQVIIRIIKAKRASVCINPPPLPSYPSYTPHTHTCVPRSPHTTAL